MTYGVNEKNEETSVPKTSSTDVTPEDVRPDYLPIRRPISEPSKELWCTETSEQFTNYPIPKNNYKFVDDLNVRKKSDLNDDTIRMVLEPKFTDYGSIQNPTADVPPLQQHNSLHALLSPVLSLPPHNEPTTTSNGKMTQGDLYQRQPLLPNTSKTDHHSAWGHHGVHSSARNDYAIDEEEEDEIMRKTNESNGVIKINMPAPIREEPRFPQERWKTFLASIALFFGFLSTLVSLSMVHERVPESSKVGPLPDTFLDNVPKVIWALDASEYIIIFCVNSCIVAMIFQRHRFIVFRRMFLIMSLLYVYRAITMYITVLPIANPSYPCAPHSNGTTPLLIFQRVIKLMSGFGLSVNGKHVYCGDFIYSGHTVILVLSYLFIAEYTPKKFWPIHWIYWALGITGVVFLLCSHGHYSIDVVIAYFVTTRLFWIYHTLANNPNLKQSVPSNLLGREWWFWFFLYFEGNTGGVVPRQFDWPLPWPRRFQSKNRNS